jgi:hypothetical protein
LHITTHDFSTLYTKLEHHEIKRQLTQLLDNLFIHIARKKNIPVAKLRMLYCRTKGTTEWINIDTTPKSQHKPKQIALAAKDILGWTMDLIMNTVVCHNGKLYRQIIGIPMGSNPAVYIANFLFCLTMNITM